MANGRSGKRGASAQSPVVMVSLFATESVRCHNMEETTAQVLTGKQNTANQLIVQVCIIKAKFITLFLFFCETFIEPINYVNEIGKIHAAKWLDIRCRGAVSLTFAIFS